MTSRLGLGFAAVGRPGYITLGRDRDLGAERSVETMYVRTGAVLDAAWETGIRHFDVARSYGRAEEFLAKTAFGRSLEDEIGALERVEYVLLEVNMGGTAIGTGLNAPKGTRSRASRPATVIEP